ncbi:MAG: hypothetical protein LBD91_03435 [Prevotellaceae bacterium]|nr:hypothetical protein [Prevotellaceae bacterium]
MERINPIYDRQSSGRKNRQRREAQKTNSSICNSTILQEVAESLCRLFLTNNNKMRQII